MNPLIALALEEDIGRGDVTTEFFVDPDRNGSARLLAKESSVVAGTSVTADVFRAVDASLSVTIIARDGTVLAPGDTALLVSGRLASLLVAERTALNFLQHLSGIATQTRAFVDVLRGTTATILDTRKTTPGWRALEKAAVAAGGGTNHRMGLHDMVMVKDNHLAGGCGIGGLPSAIQRVRTAHPGITIEVEADTIDQVRAFAAIPTIDIILLDNMTNDEMREAVTLRRPGLRFEASGNVTLERLRSIAETGVDFISSGALTHSVRAADFSMEIVAGT